MSDSAEYTPPKVWTWNKASGGRFANINRPISGATHEKELPVGRHPLQLYSLGTPNGVKVTVMLEELLALGPQRRGVRRLADPDQRRRSVRQRLRRDQPELQDPGAAGSQRSEADPRVRDRRDPDASRGEVRRVPADRARRARRVPVVAVLADGQHAVSRRRVRPFLCLCADRRSNMRSTGSPWRRSGCWTCWTSGWRRTSTWRATIYTIADMAAWPWYGGLVKFGQYGGSRVPVGARIQERHALGRCDLRAAGGAARADGQSPAGRSVEPVARAA